jgi:hypothetical protein
MGNLFHLGGNKDWKDDIFGLNLIFTKIKMKYIFALWENELENLLSYKMWQNLNTFVYQHNTYENLKWSGGWHKWYW